MPDFPLPSTANSGEKLTVHLEVFIPFMLPGFRCIWITGLFWKKGKRTVSAIQNLSRGNKVYDVMISPLLRGVYKGKSGALFVEDLFGFTRFLLYEGEPVSLIVYPEIVKNGFNKEQIISGGDVATADMKRVRSDELLEVRKYYPGDDARRINWKMFASSGQLFLRIGEETPPPTGEITVVLHSDSNAISQMKNSVSYTDILISSYLTFVYAFVEKGCIVNAITPYVKEPIIFDPGKPDNLLKVLAGVTSYSQTNYPISKDFIYIVAHPGSEKLSEVVQSGNCEMKAFIKNLPVFQKANFYKKWFIRDSELSRLSIKEYNQLRTLKDEAERDLMNLKGLGKGKFYGEVI